MGRLWKKPKTQTYLPLNCIRHMGQLSRAEAASLWFSIFSSWLSAPAALPGWGSSTGAPVASPTGRSPWWAWGFSSPFSLLSALLFCAVPVRCCCWGLKGAAGLCKAEGCAELLCPGRLQDSGLTPSSETPFVSAPDTVLAGSVLVPLKVFSAVDKLFSLSAWPGPLCNSLLSVGCWELRSLGFRHFPLWKGGNDTHWKSFIPTVKTSWCSGLFSCCFYNTHTQRKCLKQMQLNQYLNSGFGNTLQILKKLIYREEKNILFMSLHQELPAADGIWVCP